MAKKVLNANNASDEMVNDAMAQLVAQTQNATTQTNDDNEEEDDDVVNASSFKEIIKDLLANPNCKKVSAIVKNVNWEEKEGVNGPWIRVSMTLRNKVRGYVPNDDGTYSLGHTNIIYTSLYALIGAIRENDTLSWLGNSILNNPDSLNPILNGATITIIQHELENGEDYENPFSSNYNPIHIDHDSIFNYVVSFKLSKVGEKFVDKVADIMAEKMLNS